MKDGFQNSSAVFEHLLVGEDRGKEPEESRVILLGAWSGRGLLGGGSGLLRALSLGRSVGPSRQVDSWI